MSSSSSRNHENHEMKFLKTTLDQNNPLSVLQDPPTLKAESPIWGRQKGVTRFVLISPFCSDLSSSFSGIPRFVPICSDFFGFVPICFQNKSGKPLSAHPTCKSRIKCNKQKNFGTGGSFETAVARHYAADVQKCFVLPRRRSRKTAHIGETTAVARYYGFECRSIFHTEGSFGNRSVQNDPSVLQMLPRSNP